jgi:hypothetical protein
MRVKDGDIVEFLAISWDAKEWEFDNPAIVLKPVIWYTDDGRSCENMIQDLIDSLCCDEEVENEDIINEFNRMRWKLSTLKRVARNRLAGKDDWKTKIREVVYQKVVFYSHDDIDYEGLDCQIIETKKA